MSALLEIHCLQRKSLSSVEQNIKKLVKFGNLFLNRFAMNEDASSKILKIFELVDRETMNKGWDH